MGTNYYLNIDACECCKRSRKQLHIGKSSAGWVFALHVGASPWDDEPKSWTEWLDLIRDPKNTIEDEYGTVHTADEIIATITQRSRDRTDWSKLGSIYNMTEQEFHHANSSMRGNLMACCDPVTQQNMEMAHSICTQENSRERI